MTDEYLCVQDEKAFEAAFASKFNLQPRALRVYAPQAQKEPWYLDPDSGGPNPIVKKPGVQYDDSYPEGTEFP